MPTGVLINVSSVIVGGIVGGIAGKKLSAEFKTQITLIFGVCSMSMGIFTLGLMQNMPAVVFAVVIGTGLGFVLKLGKWINHGASMMEKPIAAMAKSKESTLSQEEFVSALTTAIVLFCASGTGIYGSLDAGMTGDNTILISKSILDLFTAAIFAANLGYVVSIIALPQFIIFFLLFLGAKQILPLTTPEMINDFRAAGAFLMIATGFRMMKVKEFPVADMIPAMILAMPSSHLWTNFIVPLI
ncbi:DUF554 domain-containing protein [Enterococcus casseliflavus]|uniref:DUF554 domain-containing protein n=1 Tax=Enterococcus casseliflavus TaxID=37734 RepID=UPI003D0CDFBA